jgi:hypothetical protein
MSEFDFSQLSLEGVEAARGGATLKPGIYVCTVDGVEIKKNPGKATQLVVELVDEGGQGKVTDFISLAHARAAVDDKCRQAVEIGRSRLKALLEHGGHPNPDKPGDISTLKGLRVGVRVEQGDDWVDDKGATRKGGGKPARNGAYLPASQVRSAGPATIAATASVKTKKDLDIPF